MRRRRLRSALGYDCVPVLGLALVGHEKLVLDALKALLELLSLNFSETPLILSNLAISAQTRTPIKSGKNTLLILAVEAVDLLTIRPLRHRIFRVHLTCCIL